EQMSLFVQKPKRDERAAARALARVRAALGDDAVVRAQLVEGHLPEARFVWEPIERLAAPAPVAVTPPTLLRRLWAQPLPLPPRPPQEPDGCLLRGLDHGPVARFIGPYVVSGAWWHREIQREYYIAEMRDGDLLWVYYDRKRRQWFMQGLVS